MMEVCENCKFWCKLFAGADGTIPYGECRRYPPVQKQDGAVIYSEAYDDHRINTSQWEIFTYGADWCGEFVKENGKWHDD